MTIKVDVKAPSQKRGYAEFVELLRRHGTAGVRIRKSCLLISTLPVPMVGPPIIVPCWSPDGSKILFNTMMVRKAMIMDNFLSESTVSE
jgi:hypothetical protein